MDDESEGRREDLQRGDRWQPQRESRIQARRQLRSIPRSPKTTNACSECLKSLPCDYISRRPWQLLRHGNQICSVEGRRRDTFHRSRRLQEIRRLKGSRLFELSWQSSRNPATQNEALVGGRRRRWARSRGALRRLRRRRRRIRRPWWSTHARTSGSSRASSPACGGRSTVPSASRSRCSCPRARSEPRRSTWSFTSMAARSFPSTPSRSSAAAMRSRS